MGINMLNDSGITKCPYCNNDTFTIQQIYMERKHVPTDKKPVYFTKEVVKEVKVCYKCKKEF